MMMELEYWCSVLFIMTGGIMYVLTKNHLLSMLLSLEYMVLGVFMLLMFYMSLYDFEGLFSMIYLTFSVCEGALGLSILVSMIRTHGNDSFQSFSVLQC